MIVQHHEIAPLSSMLNVSQLVYQFVNLRSIVLEHDSTFNDPNLTDTQKKKKQIVDFDTPALVVTEHAAGNVFKKTKLKHEVSAAAILSFIKKNRKYLTLSKDGNFIFDKKGNNMEPSKYEQTLDNLSHKFDADIVEYDDLKANKELLYSIVVNRTEKRITVVFRGSVTIEDWLMNSMFAKISPKEIADSANGRDVRVHKGFSEYLFGKLKEDVVETKYDSILTALEEIYKYKGKGFVYSDYELFVTGHSLGGALAQLFAYTIAGCKRGANFLPANKPVTAMTYASPEVGGDGYLETFNNLEKEDKLRHLRVSNEGDVVPIGFNTLTPWMNYDQPGVNIHVAEGKKALVTYDKIQKFWINPFNAVKMHGLDVYGSRLMDNQENSDIISKSVEDFYKNLN